MWGGSSRVVALFPGEWDLKGVVKTVEEVIAHPARAIAVVAPTSTSCFMLLIPQAL